MQVNNFRRLMFILEMILELLIVAYITNLCMEYETGNKTTK